MLLCGCCLAHTLFHITRSPPLSLSLFVCKSFYKIRFSHHLKGISFISSKRDFPACVPLNCFLYTDSLFIRHVFSDCKGNVNILLNIKNAYMLHTYTHAQTHIGSLASRPLRFSNNNGILRFFVVVVVAAKQSDS